MWRRYPYFSWFGQHKHKDTSVYSFSGVMCPIKLKSRKNKIFFVFPPIKLLSLFSSFVSHTFFFSLFSCSSIDRLHLQYFLRECPFFLYSFSTSLVFFFLLSSFLLFFPSLLPSFLSTFQVPSIHSFPPSHFLPSPYSPLSSLSILTSTIFTENGAGFGEPGTSKGRICLIVIFRGP